MKLKKRSSSYLLYGYISREFLSNFLVAFIFFFMIFFVNSILLLVQRILLRNIDFSTMLEMVMLSMPQFLIYTFPFATLSGAAMVLGDLSSNNELLALKSSGVEEIRIFLPIILLSLVLSILTFFVSDYLLPWSNIIYRQRLTMLMRDMPTFEIEANSTNTIGNIVIANGNIDERSIYDIVMANTDRSSQNKTVTSKRGTVEMVDPSSFLYMLELESPDILITDSTDSSTNLTARAERAAFYLDFSSQVPSLTSTDPVNLSSRVLMENIREREKRQEEDRAVFYEGREGEKLIIASALKRCFRDGIDTSATIAGANENLSRRSSAPIDFYGQYYKAELAKKY